MGMIISLVSGKGGVGKTTVTACLGGTLAARGHRVLMTDGDLGLRDLDLVLGVQDEILFDAVDLWKNRCFKEDAILTLSPGLDFLPASQKYRWEDLGRKGYMKMLRHLAEDYDYVLLDAPAGIGKGCEIALELADQILIVVEPMWVSLRNAERVMQLCREQRRFNYAIVVNSYPPELADRLISIGEIMNALQAESLASILPESHAVRRFTQDGDLQHIDEDAIFHHMFRPLLEYVETGEAWTEEKLTLAFDRMADVNRQRELAGRGSMADRSTGAGRESLPAGSAPTAGVYVPPAGASAGTESKESLLNRQRRSMWRYRRR